MKTNLFTLFGRGTRRENHNGAPSVSAGFVAPLLTLRALTCAAFCALALALATNALAADPTSPLTKDTETATTYVFSTANATKTLDGAGFTLTYTGTANSGDPGGLVWADNIMQFDVKDITLTGGNIEQGATIYNYGGGGFHAGWTGSGQASKKITLTDVTVENNTVKNAADVTLGALSGGGVHIHGTEDAQLKNVTISGNNLTNTLGTAYGGGFYIFGSDKVVFSADVDKTNTISDNTATSGTVAAGGGAAFAYNASNWSSWTGIPVIAVEDTKIENNKATSTANGDAYGGGIYLSNQLTGIHLTSPGTFTFKNSLIKGNVAEAKGSGAALGGGMYINQGDKKIATTITDTSFINNKAISATGTAQGGAIWTNSDITIKAVADDVVFSGNTANGKANDIHLANNANVTFTMAAGKTITLNGGITATAGNTSKVIVDGDSAEGTELVLGVENALKDVNSVALTDNAVINIGNFNQVFNNLTGTAGTKIHNDLASVELATSIAGDYSGNINIKGTLTKTGTEKQTVSGSISAGALSVNAGELVLDSSSGTFTITGGSPTGTTSGAAGKLTISANTELKVEAGGQVAAGSLDASAGTFTDTTGSVTNITGLADFGVNAQTFNGNVTFGELTAGDVVVDGHLKVVGKSSVANYTINADKQISSFINADFTSSLSAANDFSVGTGVTWNVNTQAVGNGNDKQIDIAKTWGATSTLANANAALARGENMFHTVTAGEVAGGTAFGDAFLNVTWNDKVKVSDAFVNSMLLHNNATIRSAGFSRLDYAQRANAAASNYRGQCASFSRDIWVNYVGRANELESNFRIGQKSKFTSNGVQVGFDLLTSKCAVLGVMFGYENHEGKLVNDTMKADDYYLGVYGVRRFGDCWDVRGAFGIGSQNYDINRWSNGNGLYRSATRGNTVEGTLELGRKVVMNPCLSFRPVIAFDFYSNAIAGAQETGANYDFALTYGNSSLTQAFARFGSDVQWNSGRFNANGGLYYSYQMAKDGSTLRTMAYGNGANYGLANMMQGSDLGKSVLTFTAGTNYAICSNWMVFANYMGDCYTDRAGSPLSHTGMLGTQFVW